MNDIRKFQRGDIVWAIIHNNKCFPALVLTSNDLGISLSFFNNNNHTPSRTFFVDSELLPFEQPFPFKPSLSPQNDAFRSALRLFGLNVVSSLRCRCLAGYDEKRVLNGSGCRFDPTGVLGFVLDAAVFNWVEDSCVVGAVKVVAQLHAFRRYSSIHQKKVYRETRKLGDNVKQHSSLSQKVHSVTLESTALESKEKHQVISKQVEENMAISAIRRLQSTFPVSLGKSEHSFQNKFFIIPEAPTNSRKTELFMHSPALSPFHIWGNIVNLDKQSLLRFKNILNHGIVEICFGNCSRMSEAHFSISSSFKTHLINALEIETAICLNRKRKQLDKHGLCKCLPYTSRVQGSEGNAYISKNTRPRISHIKMLEPEESIQRDNQACIQTNINFSYEVQEVDLKISPNLFSKQSFPCELSPNLAFSFNSDNYEANASATKVKFTLESNSFVYQETLQRNCDADVTHLKSKETARIESSSGDCLVVAGKVASCSIFNSKVGQQPKTHVPFCSKSLHMKFPKNFNLPSKEKLIKKFTVFGSVDSSRTRIFWYTGSAQVAFYEVSDAVAAYQYAKRKAMFGEANIRFWLDPFEHKRRELKCLYPMHPSAYKLIGPPLKSCLKKFNNLKQENRKKQYRVRFTKETL